VETPQGVLDQFRAFLNDSLAAVGFALSGLRQLETTLVTMDQTPRVPGNPDPTIYVGRGDPNDAPGVMAGWRLSEALARLVTDGPIDTLLSQQWLVYFYSGWEHEFRPRLADAHDCTTGKLQYPLFGDIRMLRDDIVHHRGIASEGKTGRCAVLRWFKVGDAILLNGEHQIEISNLIPWVDLEGGPR